MDDRAATDTATAAARAWGGATSPPRLILNRENAVFEVRFASGWHGALRLHRQGYQSADAIRSELRWTETLADAGFACPWPLRTLDGALIHTVPDGPVASVVQWIDAAPIGAMGQPFAGTMAEQTSVYHRLGALLADLHLTADQTAPDDLIRPAWDARALCCTESPLWGRFWANPALSAADTALLCAARDAAHARLIEIGTLGTGLIHADVLQENVLHKGRQLFLIDFDDSGHGYRLYDLATAVIQHEGTPAYVPLTDALWEGYQDEGGPLPADARADLAMFVMLRAMASAGWIIDRAPEHDPRQMVYAARAVRLARAFVQG